MVRKSRAISPVIATVILVAVACMTALAASFWVGGITNAYMKTEILEVSTSMASTPQGWNVTVYLKNAGPDTISFLEPYVNGVPLPGDFNNTGLDVLLSGGEQIAHIEIPAAFSSAGTSIEIEIRTASGMKYPNLVTLS